MPVIKPKSGEKESDFVSRCVSDLMDKDPKRDNKQAVAICYSTFETETKKKKVQERISKIKI